MERPDKTNRGITSALFALSIRGESIGPFSARHPGNPSVARTKRRERDGSLRLATRSHQREETPVKPRKIECTPRKESHPRFSSSNFATRRTIPPILSFSIDSPAAKAPNAESFGKVSLLVALSLSLSLSLSARTRRFGSERYDQFAASFEHRR